MMNHHFSRRSLLLLAILIAPTGITTQPAISAELNEPTGQTILVVTGNITKTNAPGQAEFDYAMLEKLGMVQVKISTVWTGDDSVFEGVLSRRLLEFLGATGSLVVAKAADDYSITIPLEELTEYNALLATSLNGERMQLRTRGPIWIIYDNNDRPDLDEDEANERMVWQLEELEIK